MALYARNGRWLMPVVLKGGLHHAGDGKGMLSEIFGCKITAFCTQNNFLCEIFTSKSIESGKNVPILHFLVFGFISFLRTNTCSCVIWKKVEKDCGKALFHLVVCVIPNKSVTFATGIAVHVFLPSVMKAPWGISAGDVSSVAVDKSEIPEVFGKHVAQEVRFLCVFQSLYGL